MREKIISGINISSIGQGAGSYGVKDQKSWINVIRKGIDLGLTFIDTAEIYQNGISEKLVGEAIDGIRNKAFIATKVSPENLSYNKVLDSAEKSLKRLKIEYIDLYQIHWPNPSIPIEETMEAMNTLFSQGKIKYVGVSNFSHNEYINASKFVEGELVSNQCEYNLFERGIEESFLPFAESENIITIAYSPFRRSEKGQEVLDNLATKYNANINQIILAWLISKPTVIPIPMTTKINHMQENAAAANINLQQSDIILINETFKNNVCEIPISRIRVIPIENEIIYTSLEEAKLNPAGLMPSPLEIAEEIKKDSYFKPVHLMPTSDKSGKYDYDIIQGKNRYWASIIAFGDNHNIKAYIY